MSYHTITLIGNNATATTTHTVVSAFNVARFDKFTLELQNCSTAVDVSAISLQAALDPTPEASGTFEHINWVSISGIVPLQDKLGPTASIFTSAVNNAWSWLRLRGAYSAAGANQHLILQIGGHLRR